MPRLLGFKEAIKYLRISTRTFYNLKKKGQIPVIKKRGRLFLDLDEFDRQFNGWDNLKSGKE